MNLVSNLVSYPHPCLQLVRLALVLSLMLMLMVVLVVVVGIGIGIEKRPRSTPTSMQLTYELPHRFFAPAVRGWLTSEF